MQDNSIVKIKTWQRKYQEEHTLYKTWMADSKVLFPNAYSIY